ncbi:MAG: hypothetical protein IT317_09845 [Anaerolineales bacterium]|nr:hypothetical protein [Anaerolineales bacterium]
MSGHQYSSDGFVTFQSARVLLTDGRLTFDPPLRWGSQIIAASKYGIGMSLAYLLYLVPLRQLRPDLFVQTFDPQMAYDQRLLFNELYLYSSTLNALVVAGVAVVTYLTARELRLSSGWAVVAALIVGLASPLAVYARLDFAQPLITLCLMAALWLWLRARDNPSGLVALSAGLIMAAGVLTRFDFIVVSVPALLVLALWPLLSAKPAERRRRLRGLTLAALAVGAALAVVLGLNLLKFGSATAFGYPNAWNSTLEPVLQALVGHLVSPGAGILWYFPVVTLLPVALPGFVAHRPRVGLVLVLLLVSYLLLYSVWRNWPGGYAWGPRFLVPLVPLMTLAGVYWAAAGAQRWQRWWLGGAAGASWLVSLNGILFSFLDLFSTCGCLNQGPVGSERFTWAGSNLLAGWNFPVEWHRASMVQAFDLLWLRVLVGSVSAAIAIVALTALIVAAGLGLNCLLRAERQTRAPMYD